MIKLFSSVVIAAFAFSADPLAAAAAHPAPGKSLEDYLAAVNCKVEDLAADTSSDIYYHGTALASAERIAYAIDQVKVIGKAKSFSVRSAALQSAERAFHDLYVPAGGFGGGLYDTLNDCALGFVDYLTNEYADVRPIQRSDSLFMASVIHALDNSVPSSRGTKTEEITQKIFVSIAALKDVTKDDLVPAGDVLNPSDAGFIADAAREYLGHQSQLFNQFDISAERMAWLEAQLNGHDEKMQHALFPILTERLFDNVGDAKLKALALKTLQLWIAELPKILAEPTTTLDAYTYAITLINCLGDYSFHYQQQDAALEVLNDIVQKDGAFALTSDVFEGKERLKLAAQTAIQTIETNRAIGGQGDINLMMNYYDLRRQEKRFPYIIQFNP